MKQITVPDIGDFKDVAVIEVLVTVGDRVESDQPVAVIESDKATLEIPCPEGGIVGTLDIRVGDKVSVGSPLLSLRTVALDDATAREVAEIGERPPPSASDNVADLPVPAAVPQSVFEPRIYAGPVVRKIARELGVKLEQVQGSGPRGRIVAKDVQGLVKSIVTNEAAGHDRRGEPPGSGGSLSAVLPWPKVDHARFGPVESVALSRIRKTSGAVLHRNWVMIPHVTNHDDADVTELENFRKQINKEHENAGVKISPLAFVMKACVAALIAFPQFNASLEGETLVLKRYYHIGFAVDTPDGLVVPVIRDADQKGVAQLAGEIAGLAEKARAGKLSSAMMQGGSFSISSLGGVGGSYFTPIINAPEVAILGVGKMQTRTVWDGGQPLPRAILPLSLSWDHRAVDGVAAGRFNAYLAKVLGDLRRLVL